MPMCSKSLENVREIPPFRNDFVGSDSHLKSIQIVQILYLEKQR